METKPVSEIEMQEFLELNKVETHPFYYRFFYSTNQKAIVAKRIRKNMIVSLPERRMYLQTDLDDCSSMAKALNMLEEFKKKTGVFSIGRQ